MSDAADSDFLEHLHLGVGQGAGRSHDYGFAGMDAERVEVLHAGHGETVVVRIPDDLELNLLPALEALLDKDLRGEGEGRLGYLPETLLVLADTRTQTSEGVG